MVPVAALSRVPGNPVGPARRTKLGPRGRYRRFECRIGFSRGVIASLIGGLSLAALLIAVVDWRSSWSRETSLRPPPLSIVVLPFANLGDGREQQYIADGVTDDLTTICRGSGRRS
jgi:hypothetical protein